MSRLVLTALFIDRQAPAEAARRYGVHRSWVYRLKARYEAEGQVALEPRSRRPKTSPAASPPATVALSHRATAPADRIRAGCRPGHHRLAPGPPAPAPRVTGHDQPLSRAGLVTPEPKKRPRSSYVRFAADLPNEIWQSDVTHYRLAAGADSEILTWLDDHSRYALSVTAHQRVSGLIVLATFRATVAAHGIPASTLTDNGMVFTTRFAGGRGGCSALEADLRRLNVAQKNSRPNHPSTCGKVERFQQTMKKWLRAQPAQPTTVRQLQALLDAFAAEYNTRRPHRSLPRRATPAAIYQMRPKALPAASRHAETHLRVRHDRIDDSGVVTLRHNGRLHHIGVGRTYARTHVVLLAADLEIRIVNAITGDSCASSPSTRLSITSRSPDNPDPAGSGVADVLRDHIGSGGRI